MKSEHQIRETIINKARRAAGVGRREVRDSFHLQVRSQAIEVLDRMLAAGELFECLRPTVLAGKPQRRIFLERGDGSRWSAGLVKEAPKIPRPAVHHAPKKATPYVPPTVTRRETPIGRYEVSGPVPAVTNPAECRPWANVAAQARAGA